MARYDPSQIAVGLQAGFDRAIRLNVGLDWYSQELAGPIRAAIEEQLRHLEDEPVLSDRFVVLFSEIIALSYSARAYYEDDPLTADDLGMYLRHTVHVLNSFVHR